MGKLVLENVSRIFDKKGHGVFDVNLNIDDGDFFVILGPSGCGKTTTLRIMAGLETVDSGRIFLDDIEITDFPPRNRDIAMVFQNYALYPFLSVRDNLKFPLKIAKMDKNEMEDKIEKVSKLLGISEILDMKPGQISGGQRQRVALGRAIVREPKLFLMDEPLSNLDAKLRAQMRVELKKLQRELKTTTVYVTHDQVEASTLADTAVIMNGGRVIQLGDPAEIYAQPENKFVAGFMGDPQMNFINGRLYEKNGEAMLESLGKTYQIDGLELPGGYSDDVVVGFRPENTLESSQGIKAKVTGKQIMGKIIYEFMVLEDGTSISMETNIENSHNPDELISIEPDISKIHLFSGPDGKRIYSGGDKKLREIENSEKVIQ
ncbi:ABC transporter ATP-binding protein [Caldiplasma sukawensis]